MYPVDRWCHRSSPVWGEPKTTAQLNNYSHYSSTCSTLDLFAVVVLAFWDIVRPRRTKKAELVVGRGGSIWGNTPRTQGKLVNGTTILNSVQLLILIVGWTRVYGIMYLDMCHSVLLLVVPGCRQMPYCLSVWNRKHSYYTVASR